MNEIEFQQNFHKYPWGLRELYFRLIKTGAVFSQIYPYLLKEYGVGEVGLPSYESKRTLRKNK